MRCQFPTPQTEQCGALVFESPELEQVRQIYGLDVEACFYHQRVLLGRSEPVARYLSDEEMTASMRGRPHGDGRRLDQYVTWDAPELG